MSGRRGIPTGGLPILQKVKTVQEQAVARQTAVGTMIVPVKVSTIQDLARLISETTDQFAEEAASKVGEPIRILSASPSVFQTAGGTPALMVCYVFERLVQ